jgi:hypothetical protein
MAKVSHKALFEKLRDTTVLAKCELYAKWTLPQLMADVSTTRGKTSVVVERDYQEMGAILVNHLATKLARLLFPTAHPFFRIQPSKALEALGAKNGVDPAQIQAGLARLEMDAAKRVFLNSGYAQLILALKHLIVTGNVLVYRDSTTARCSAYGVQSFSVRRDGRGNMLDCVLREFTYVEALDTRTQELLRAADRTKYSRPEQQVEIYTRIHRVMKDAGPVMEVSQEIDTYPIGETSSYPEHMCPWFIPTWSLITGEHYGRGMIEDYAGGFASLSDLSEGAALYTIEILRVIHLVGMAGGTDIDDLRAAETGEYVRGDGNTVVAMESGDSAKLLQVENKIASVFGRLAKAFMYGGNTRNAERVTAYEIQMEAQEAENALGGVYSALSQGLQVPLAHTLSIEAAPQSLAGMIDGSLKLDVIAGIPALGRTSDVQNLMMAAQEVATVVPIAQMDSRISPTKIVDMVMAGRSVDTEAIFYSKEEQAQIAAATQQQQQGQQQMLQAESLGDAAQQLNTMQGTA